MKTREWKTKMLEQLRQWGEEATMIALFDFKGLTVAEMNDLRKQLKEKGYNVKVVKNNLMKLVFADKIPEITDVLVGPTAIIISFSDEVEPVKIFADFSKEVEKGELKAGIMHGQFLDKEEIERLAKLPSTQELRAQVVGAVAGPLYGIVGVLSGVMRNLVYAINAIKEKKEKEG
ncbi:MAG: 50S ribosomal protein L10 [Thermotogae bacterium]|nr:50S ribosomal protein L10 [Thermotogota bacterium]